MPCTSSIHQQRIEDVNDSGGIYIAGAQLLRNWDCEPYADLSGCESIEDGDEVAIQVAVAAGRGTLTRDHDYIESVVQQER